MKNILILLFLIPFSLLAQNSPSGGIEMADTLRENGKIYVVVAILLLILIGLIVYMIFTDKKITRLEKQIFLNKDKNTH